MMDVDLFWLMKHCFITVESQLPTMGLYAWPDQIIMTIKK